MDRSKSPATDSRASSPERTPESDMLLPEQPLSPLANTPPTSSSPVRIVLPLLASPPLRFRTPNKMSLRTLDYDQPALHTPRAEASESIKVIIRIRPTNAPIESGEKGIKWTQRSINVVWDNSEKSLKQAIVAQLKRKEFFFDRVYDPDSKQRDIYDDHCHAMVMKCLSGFNATIFAYGQTSSGKTHTMMGPPFGSGVALEEEGVIPRCGLSIFSYITACHSQSPRTQQFNVLVSYLEIYNEKVYDLLGPQATKVLREKVSLEINEHPVSGFFVAGLSKHSISSGEEVQKLIREGSKNRCVSSTKMNDLSSRSHSVLTFWIHKSTLEHDLPTTAIASQLNLVDLAGSEKYDINLTPQSKMQQGRETTNINQSLSCLANVIAALSAGADLTQTPETKTPPRHVPYRDSKLTLLLKSSLGGNASTLMIACLNPAFTNIIESVSTLRYAHRAKLVKNRPTLNTDPKDALIHRIRLISAELAEAQEQLRLQSSLPGRLAKLVRQTYIKVRESTRALGVPLNEDLWTAEAGTEIEEEERRSKLDTNNINDEKKEGGAKEKPITPKGEEEEKKEEEERSDEEGDEEEEEEEEVKGNEEELKAVRWDTDRLVRLHELLKNSSNRERATEVASSSSSVSSATAPSLSASLPQAFALSTSCPSFSSSSSSLVPPSLSTNQPPIINLTPPTATAETVSTLTLSIPLATTVTVPTTSTPIITTTTTATTTATTTPITPTVTPLTSPTITTTITTTTTITVSESPSPSSTFASPPLTVSVGSWAEIERPISEFLQQAQTELNSITEGLAELENQSVPCPSVAMQEELKTEQAKYEELCRQVQVAQTEVEAMGTGLGVASPQKNTEADYRAYHEIATLRSDRMLSLRVAKQKLAQQKEKLDNLQATLKSKQIAEENEQFSRISHTRLIQRQHTLLKMEEQLWSGVAAHKPDAKSLYSITATPLSSSSSLRTTLSPLLTSSSSSLSVPPLSFTISLPSPSLPQVSHISPVLVASSSATTTVVSPLPSPLPVAFSFSPISLAAADKDKVKSEGTQSDALAKENALLKQQLADMTSALEALQTTQRQPDLSAPFTSSTVSTISPSLLTTTTTTTTNNNNDTTTTASSTTTAVSSSRSTRETREGSRRHGIEALSSMAFRPEKETKNLVRLAELQESLARVAASSSTAPHKTASFPPPPPRRRRPPPPPPESATTTSAPLSLLPALLYSATLRMTLASEYRAFEAERYAHLVEEAKQRNLERDAEIHDLQEDLRHTRHAKTELAICSAAALAETKDMLTKLEEQVEYLTNKEKEAHRPRMSMSLSRSRR